MDKYGRYYIGHLAVQVDQVNLSYQLFRRLEGPFLIFAVLLMQKLVLVYFAGDLFSEEKWGFEVGAVGEFYDGNLQFLYL